MDKTHFISGVFDLYDERLLESRLTEEGNVCGALLKDITLYDDCGLTQKDFITKSGRLLFRIGQEIRAKKYYDFDEILLNSDLYSKSISHEKLPQLFYDESRKLTYLDIVIKDKDYFEYIGEKGCVPNFNWNYKDTFDFKLTNIDELLSYHSIQFYKLTSYEPE